MGHNVGSESSDWGSFCYTVYEKPLLANGHYAFNFLKYVFNDLNRKGEEENFLEFTSNKSLPLGSTVWKDKGW